MATKKAADHTLYHLSPKGFWKKFRDVVVVNPDISSGLPIQGLNRWPPPASRPERYNTPATKASDIAMNPYWKRDVRRAYPRLSMVTQNELSTLLLEHSSAQQIAAPTDKDPNAKMIVAAPQEAKELTESISSVAAKGKLFSASKLPPSMKTPFKKWAPAPGDDVGADPHAYFPMYLVK
ncbi:hypothetical protein BD626DRAFT_475300 [Schizophyllum amplum]|uniref:Uncharacterized protein n=1 Tax=Schizophyllum amplum TaxID=97359 RepID=A0A550CYB4_9AGAR|nr:hypothetical protein BD626DRAFT_475300 [Auriculariopsis ampla]